MNKIRNLEEFRQKLLDLKKSISERKYPFIDDTPVKKAARIAKAKQDYYYFAMTYFSEYIECDFAEFQREEIDKAINCLRNKREEIQGEYWFRGAGKTVNFGVILPIWLMIINQGKYFIFVGKDKKIITERTIAVRAEMTYNQSLIHDYPEIAMKDIAGDPMLQGEEADFESPTGARFRALGYKMSIRGTIHGCHRPRYILIDDFENHTDTNPVIAEEKLSYVTGEAFGAFGKDGGVIVWLGNLTHSQSAANRFMERCELEIDNPGISCRLVYGMDEETGEPTWPEAFTREKIAAKRKTMGEIEFNRHFLMKPLIEGDVFKKEWLKDYNPYSVDFVKNNSQRLPKTASAQELKNTLLTMPGMADLREGQIVTYCDPSLGKKESNDYKAIETISFWKGYYWVLDRCVRRMSIMDMFEYMYNLNDKYKTTIYMEINFWQILLMEFIPKLAEKKGYILPVRGINNTLSKEERILMLQPLYQFGFIYDCTTGKDKVVFTEQLLGFPNMSNDDGPDAESGAIARFKEIAQGCSYESIGKREGSDFGMML